MDFRDLHAYKHGFELAHINNWLPKINPLGIS